MRIVFIGAGIMGAPMARNLAAAGFEGAVYGVNPKRDEVHGKPCVATVADLPEPVDAVVVAIPAAGAPVEAMLPIRGCPASASATSSLVSVSAAAAVSAPSDG